MTDNAIIGGRLTTARVCLRWLDTADERDVPFVVEVCDDVSIPTERKVDGKTVLGSAGDARRGRGVEVWRFNDDEGVRHGKSSERIGGAR